MNHIKKQNIIDEVQYKVSRLKEIMPQLDKKKIVIYGTGVNAKRALEYMHSLNILGMMDCQLTGKYILGKKVLSQEEIQLLGIDVILIAAEPQSTQIVYKRILPFCLKNNITILDIYGCDEILLHKNILEQEMAYTRMKEDGLKRYIDANKVLFFPFKNVICSEVISEKKILFKKLEKILEQRDISSSNFARKRLAAEERAANGMDVSRKEIYRLLSVMLSVDKKQIESIEKVEEELILENQIPRFKIIELIKYAISKGKEIYIYSDMLDGDWIISNLLERCGIKHYNRILTSSNKLARTLGEAIRVVGERCGYNNVLCFGENESIDLILPQLYNANFQLIWGSLDTFFKATGLQIDIKTIRSNPNAEEIIKDILGVYENPFLNQIDCSAFDKFISEKIGWYGEEGDIEVELLPVKQWGKFNGIEKLFFSETENPCVTIIISINNQSNDIYNCLKSVLCNTDNVEYEVIVVNYGAYDIQAKLEKVVSGITMIYNDKNRNIVKSFNAITSVARGKYLVLLDDDTQVQLNWLQPLIECMEVKEDIGLAGVKLVYQSGSLQEAGNIVWNDGSICRYGEGKKPDAPEYSYVREVDFVSGTAFLIRKKLWKEIGGYDGAYFSAYFRDADLAFEVRKSGYRVIYQPDSVVVHLDEDMKELCQKEDQGIFLKKWKELISENQNMKNDNILSASERKQKCKTVIFVSEYVPTYDKDAGSRTIDFYIQEFKLRGYIVKFIPANFIRSEPYTHRLEQMGVEVLGGKYYRKTIFEWIAYMHKDIDYVFLNYPNASGHFIDVFKKFGIPVIYYGVDLHYLRIQREYQLFGIIDKKEEAKELYTKEAYLIKNSDVVYYPSLVEIDIVNKEFKRSDAKQLIIYTYDIKNICNTYKPENRKGLMFLGSYNHAPNVDAIQWFSTEIFPQIYNELKIPFYIAGSNIPYNIVKKDIEGIKVLGSLTDTELKEMYEEVKMVVVPLRYGAGIKGKVIEAMYYGVPTITTPIGIEGIPNEEGAVKVVEDAGSFAEAVVQLYHSDGILTRMSIAGQRIIKQYYSREAAWNNIAEDFG